MWGWDGCWDMGLFWGVGRCPLTCCPPSEAAPYLPAEEKSPLFSIQREGIEDNGVLYRVNRSVMGARGLRGSDHHAGTGCGPRAAGPRAGGA